jgi:hypothetical protein
MVLKQLKLFIPRQDLYAKVVRQKKNIEHILSQYPSYKFKKDSDGKTIHEIYIVKFTK